MASTLVQIRMDEDLKAEASALYEELGIDLPTAVRMFIKRSVMVKGIPFSMTLPKEEYKAERAYRAMQEIGEASERSGTADMTLEEIDEEIRASRAARKTEKDGE